MAKIKLDPMKLQSRLTVMDAKRMLKNLAENEPNAKLREAALKRQVMELSRQVGELKDVVARFFGETGMKGQRLVRAFLDDGDLVCVHEPVRKGGHRDRVTLVRGSSIHPQPVREMGDDIPPADWNY